eukprot:CAMPEP_0174947724 /NCGR_PEP_ID=MMETSP1355-20121228/87253_1 /TAXON_ID=464990 /ORGANISM="Hemiselmis tepida, Strain CCMP443" /LENGTH=296 /DNA_ID=CAMNT_0016195207 /DNA_START=38 /DNA_END=928 /DNA_ORIENTATION=+
MLVDVPKQVLVTGASGRTGFAVFKLLWENQKEFVAQALVRSEKGAKMLEKLGASVGDSESIKSSNAKLRALGMPAEDEDPDIFIGDILDGDSLAPALRNCDALVICTSGVPQLRKTELFKSILSKLIGRQRMPKFYYKEMPEQVDWEGCRNQIDAAKEAGVEHIVLVSSMGVTPAKNNDDNILNQIGDGNILVWKAKAEAYLAASGVDYTVIHPGGLLNKAGGEREIVLGVNDELLDGYEARGATRAIPRQDVAMLIVQALRHKELVTNKSFDCVSKAPGEGRTTVSFAPLFEALS